MTVGWRALTGSTMAYPSVYGAFSLGMSLPIDRVDAALTAGSFCVAIVAVIVTWVVGAKKLLQMAASVFVSSSLAIVLLLIL